MVLEGQGGGRLLIKLVQKGYYLWFRISLFFLFTLIHFLLLLTPSPQLLHQLLKFPHLLLQFMNI